MAKSTETDALVKVDEMLAATQGMVVQGTGKNLATAFEGMVIEEIVKIPEGGTLVGIYLGPGGETDVTDPTTGEARKLATWKVRHLSNPQIVALVLDCAKLHRFFSGIPKGSRVTLYRRGSIRSNAGRIVNDYVTGHVPPAEQAAAAG